MKARRMVGGWNIVFGEGDERWQFPDPGSERISDANWGARHAGDEGKVRNALILAEVASALHYLVHTCPTTKRACEMLAAVRRAVRELPETQRAGEGET